MKILTFLICCATSCFAQMNYAPRHDPQISVKNRILTKVNGNVISVVDVMKKMDMMLHQNYPQFADSSQARFQFYSASWRSVLMEMIDTELILSDAEEREIKLTDGELREEMEDRFGPGVQLTLEKIGITYDDAWAMVKKEMIVRRMMWFFAQSKAVQSVSPQSIRDAYRHYLKENPPHQECTYRVITLRADNNEEESEEVLAQNICELLNKTQESLETAALHLKEWEKSHLGTAVTVSNEYVAKDCDLSESHRNVLSHLSPGSYSKPITQTSRAENKPVHRIFHLADRIDHPASSFEDTVPQLKHELTQKAMAKESEAYLQKLRKYYGFDQSGLRETLPDNLQPFALE
jgi:hypothetical protein